MPARLQGSRPRRPVPSGGKKFRLARRPSSAERARALEVLAEATRVLQDASAAKGWMRDRNPALGGKTPGSMVLTEAGTAEVLNLLGRIEHGIPS